MLVLLLLLLSVSGCFGAKDEPFWQATPTRYTWPGTQIADWKQLPFAQIPVQILASQHSTIEFLLLLPSALWFFRYSIYGPWSQRNNY